MSVLLGNGDGTFQIRQNFAARPGPHSVAAADVNGDGRKDLVVANRTDNTVGVLLGNGDGTFQKQQSFAVGSGPEAVAVADVNGDGRKDLVVANYASNDVSVLLGHGDGTFSPSTPTSGVGLRNTPLLADLNGDGFSDNVVLHSSGNILFYKGLSGTNNTFAPRVILKDKAAPGEDRPARDLTVLHTGAGWVIATADSLPDPTLATPEHPFLYTVSLYTIPVDIQVSGTTAFVPRTTAFATTLLPTRIAAADLTGDGLDDLVVANSLDNSIRVAFQQADGKFSPPITLPTGEAPSDISLVDVNGDGLLDIVVTNQASGDVSVFLNDTSHAFATSFRFRTGTGLYGLDTTSASPTVSTLEQSVSLATGDFTGNGRNDLVVVNRGAHSFSVLPNDGSGGFANPQTALTTSTSDGSTVNNQPGPVVAGDFNGDGKPDLAILMEDRGEVWIYIGHGDGTFSHTFTIAAGTSLTGLSVVRNTRTGFLDLLVGNAFGDVLHLQGKGDGTFQLAGSRTSLDVQDLGNGQPSALVANQQTDHVTIQVPKAGSPQFVQVEPLDANNPATQLAPGAVKWAQLEGSRGPFYAIVVESGSNDVLVYRLTGFDAAGRPTFAPPQTYFVGTDPVSVTIQDIKETKGDGVQDMLIADQGSNDIATLFGSLDASGHWVGNTGPRLASGGIGPIGTTLRDMNGDGILDLVVTNSQSSTDSQSGNLAVLPGRGQGFFDDRTPQILPLPGNPIQAPSFPDTSGVGVVPVADGRLIGIDLPNASTSTRFTPPAGQDVTAAEAQADGSVLAAERGGTVLLLEPTADSILLTPTQTLTGLTGIPLDPSDLTVLETASGLQVLVTNQGEDRVFVFVFGPPSPGLGLEPEPSVPIGAPLALVLTLVAGNLPVGEPSGSGRTVTAAAVQSGGDDEANQEENSQPSAWTPNGSDSTPGLDEAVQQLDLYRRTDNSDANSPMSRWTTPVELHPWDVALAAVWESARTGLPLARWAEPEVDLLVRVLAVSGVASANTPTAERLDGLAHEDGGELPGGPIGVTPETATVPASAASAPAAVVFGDGTLQEDPALVPVRSEIVIDEPIKTTEDLPPGKGDTQPRPDLVPVPTPMPKSEEGGEAEANFLTLPLFVSALGQLTYWPNGYAAARRDRENHLALIPMNGRGMGSAQAGR